MKALAKAALHCDLYGYCAVISMTPMRPFVSRAQAVTTSCLVYDGPPWEAVLGHPADLPLLRRP